jgi:hypothetical protein
MFKIKEMFGMYKRNINCFESYNEEQINKILDKINLTGITSLTKQEIDYLNGEEIDMNIKSVEETHVFKTDENFEDDINFVYSHSYKENETIFHVGLLNCNGIDFQGMIICDADNNYESCDFTNEDEMSENYEETIYDVVESFEDVDTFLGDYVVPYLKYNINE